MTNTLDVYFALHNYDGRKTAAYNAALAAYNRLDPDEKQDAVDDWLARHTFAPGGFTSPLTVSEALLINLPSEPTSSPSRAVSTPKGSYTLSVDDNPRLNLPEIDTRELRFLADTSLTSTRKVTSKDGPETKLPGGMNNPLVARGELAALLFQLDERARTKDRLETVKELGARITHRHIAGDNRERRFIEIDGVRKYVNVIKRVDDEAKFTPKAGFHDTVFERYPEFAVHINKVEASAPSTSWRKFKSPKSALRPTPYEERFYNAARNAAREVESFINTAYTSRDPRATAKVYGDHLHRLAAIKRVDAEIAELKTHIQTAVFLRLGEAPQRNMYVCIEEPGAMSVNGSSNRFEITLPRDKYVASHEKIRSHPKMTDTIRASLYTRKPASLTETFSYRLSDTFEM